MIQVCRRENLKSGPCIKTVFLGLGIFTTKIRSSRNHLMCITGTLIQVMRRHDDVIKWKHFPRHWPLVRELPRSPVNSPHKGQWRGAFKYSLLCAWIKGWVNNGEAGDLRRYHTYYGVTVMVFILKRSKHLIITGITVFSNLFRVTANKNNNAVHNWSFVRGVNTLQLSCHVQWYNLIWSLFWSIFV